MTAITVTVSVLFGLLFGSFANVPIHRWPRGGTVSAPKRSACPACEQEIAARDNIPVVSWMLLHGRCRSCEAPIHWRYPVVEAVIATLFGLVAWRQGLTWLLPALLVMTWSCVVLSVIDLEHRKIPNALTYRLPFVLLGLLVPPTLWGPGSGDDLLRGAVVGVSVPLAFFVVGELYRLVRGRRGFGMGDVKLLVSLGLLAGYLGGFHVVVLLYGAMGSAVLVAIGLLVTGRAAMASRIPFGPYLAFGMMLAILAGDVLRSPVLSLLGLG